MPTFSIDDLLPSMPVPCLAKTCENYLDSIKPFVTEEELKTTAKVVEDFKNGVGKNLQVLLVEKAKHERNWLEKYWLDYAYLEWRDPIAPFVNTSGMLGGSSEKDFQYVPSGYKLDVRLSYVALQCFYYTEFHALLRNEKFPIHKSRSSYFSMNQWRGLFNTCRIPQPNKDRLDIHFKTVNESNECPTHLIVMYKYRFYRLETYHQGKQLNITELYRQLEKIVASGDNKAFGVGIGALTADKRDSWAQNRQHLIDLNPENANSLRQVEQSMYVIVLDESTALNNSELAKLGLCGDPKNRFFDKSVVSICTKNGRFTSNVDHTPFDGMVSGSLTLYATEGKKRDKFDISMTDSFPARSNLTEPQEIHFVYDHRIETEIQKAANIFKKNADEILSKECKIVNCNKEMIKTLRTNPDTFAQMCMQLAYYQLHRKPAPTYESATTRAYYHGRTETVRSCSSEALEWCQQMCNEDVRTRLPESQLLDLFKRACKKHDQLMGKARNNALVDRHLTGLRLIARDLDMKLPEIYKDAAWKKSGGDGNFIISSSCLGFTNCVGTCGPMCLDGYSMIYAFPDDGITFELARFASSKETCLEKISASLQSAFDRTKALFKVASKI